MPRTTPRAPHRGAVALPAGAPGSARPELRTLWYMGAKTRLCPEFIEGAAADLLPEGGTFLDLCTGTAAVARTLASRYRIFANDVQRFSATIASAHLEGDDRWREHLERLDPEADLRRASDANRRDLEKLFPFALAREAVLLPRVIAEISGNAEERLACAEYRDLVASTPEPRAEAAPGSLPESDPRFRPFAELLPGLLRDRRRDPAGAPFALITAYYGNVYFSLEQSIAIDSLRRAIAAIPAEDRLAERKRALYLAALLHAASVSTSGTSHFAQPRSIARDRELLAVARRRTIDVEAEFHAALAAIRREWGSVPRRPGNRVFRRPAEELLAEGGPLAGEEIGLVYIDPPYTADHYSRFYHLLETLVEYDYPELAVRGGALTRGRYPVAARRFQSSFCSAENVERTFRGLVERSHAIGANLLISYAADQGLLMRRWRDEGVDDPVAHFRALCRETYATVEIRERELLHSGQGDSNRAARELLVLCER